MRKVAIVCLAVVSGLALQSGPDSAKDRPPRECADVETAKEQFREKRHKYFQTEGDADERNMREAAATLISQSHRCFEATFGEDVPHGGAIDAGGVYVQDDSASGDPSEQPESSEFSLFGNKWGPDSPFSAGPNGEGPRSPGGLRTYSYMPAGVNLSGEPASPPPSVAVEDLIGFAPCFYKEISDAFSAWSAVADITFISVTDDGTPFNQSGSIGDIRIGGHSFDGPSGTLAHGYFPPPNGVTGAGDIHFDAAETWSCDGAPGSFDIGVVTLHEIGHAIGLNHDSNQTAVMNPNYNAALTYGPLSDDIIGAGEIYGSGGAATTGFFPPFGIGTNSPDSALHVVERKLNQNDHTIHVEDNRDDWKPHLLFENTHDTNPFVGFRFVAGGNVPLDFNYTQGFFRVNFADGDGRELQLDQNGNLVLTGTLTQGSDVRAKVDIEPVDPAQVLSAVAALPVSTWSYTGEPGVVHLGPMAQDFHASFGLGATPTGISSVDVDGVALASIQALEAENDRLQSQVRLLTIGFAILTLAVLLAKFRRQRSPA